MLAYALHRPHYFSSFELHHVPTAGLTRHRDPLVCGVNAMATYLLLRYGRDGIQGLPDFFDTDTNWTGETGMFCSHDGSGTLSYTDHLNLFADMKQASGLVHFMDAMTKLRSFGAMNANENQASHEETERAGRSSSYL